MVGSGSVVKPFRHQKMK